MAFFRRGVTLGDTERGYIYVRRGVTLGVTILSFLTCVHWGILPILMARMAKKSGLRGVKLPIFEHVYF